MSSPEERALPVRPGERIRQYEIVEEIGRGGMGVVFRARDTDLGRPVAMKCPWPDMAADPNHRARFLREVKAESNLAHPNIVPLYETFEERDLPWLVMQHISGQSLRGRIIRDGEMNTRDVLRFGLELAEALQHAHAKGILHRDINPQNVILSEEDRCFLTDFGLAKFQDIAASDSGASTETEPMTQRGMIIGTPQYMSPEQTRGEEVDERSDIFSLGLVLYEMATGHQPYDQTERNALFHAIQSLQPAPIQRYTRNHPDGLEHIIYKCLAKDVDERYQTARDLCADLRREQRAHRISTTDPSLLPPPPPPSRKVPVLVGLVAVVATALAAWFLVPREMERLEGRPVQLTGGESWDSHPSLSPDGSRIAFASNREGSLDIFVMDVGGGQALQVTQGPAEDDHPSWLPDGSEIVYSSYEDGVARIRRVSAFGGQSSLVLEEGWYPRVSPDGQWLAFCLTGSVGDLRVFRTPLRDPGALHPLTDDDDGIFGHHTPAWSPDGKHIVYASQENLWLVSADGAGQARPLLDEPSFVRFPAWSSTGKRIFFASAQGGTDAVWWVSPSGGDPRRLTLGTARESSPCPSADGSRLVYATQGGDHDVWILDRETGAEHRVPDLRDETMPSVAGDGSAVVFVSDARAGKRDLYLQPLVGGAPAGEVRRLTDHDGLASHPVVSPDGAWVAYYRIDGDRRDLYLVSSAGGRPVRITDAAEADLHPAWSPDGNRLAFVSDRDGDRSSLWTVPVDGAGATGEPELVAAGPVGFMAPRWSPDGLNLLAVGVDESLGDDVWIVPLDGSEPRRIPVGREIGRVHWGPEVSRIWVSARWSSGLTLRQGNPDTGDFADPERPVDFGQTTELGHFDISDDGRFIVFSRMNPRGDIWALEADPGTY